MTARTLIVGAGIGGLTTALALARRGVSAVVFERAPVLEATGAGVQLSPNASRILDGLGLGAALDALAVRPAGVTIADARTGKTLAELPLGAAAERRWGAPYRVIHRADLQAVLRDAAQAASVAINLGAGIASVEETATGVALAGNDGGRHECDLLIGADGLRSVVRGAVKLPTAVRDSGLIAYRAVLPASALPPAFAIDRVTLWLAPGAHAVIYPVRAGGEANVVLIGPAGALGPTALVASWADAARQLVAAVTKWSEWPLFDRATDPRMRRGRIALVGDASHAALPSLAQGAAFAIEDAAVLARLIGEDGADPLAAYEKARLMRVMRLPGAARRQIGVDHLGGLAARARNFALMAAPTRALLGGLDWLYGWTDGD